jgi:hypothetical protein
MLQVKSIDSFAGIIANISGKKPYAIETRGMRRIIIAGGKQLAVFRPGVPNPDIQSKEARKLLASVRASITRYIKKHDFNVSAIKKEYPVVFTNRLFWDSIPPQTEFYIIDGKHAYWRIAFILGYIPKKMYEKYAENKAMKTARNISLAILNSRHKKEFFLRDSKTHEIECDTSLYNQVYNNIRHYSYNLCGEIRNLLDDACFAYRTDGVFLLKPGLARAKKIFEKHNLLYKIEKCVKIDAKYYSTADGEIRKLI